MRGTMGNVSTFSRVFLLVAVSIMLMVSCGDEGPTNVNEEPEIVIQKKEAALEKAEQILPSDLLNSLEDEIDSQSSNIKEAFLDTLSSSLEQLVDTLSKYHSAADLKNEIERIDREAQKFISSEFGDTKAKAFNHLGLGYGKGVSIETGIEANVASGIATGLSAQGGGGSEVLYDFVNMDREVYIFTACGIGVNLAGVGIGTSLSANVGLSGYKKWLLNLIQDKRNNKFQGPAKASSFGVGASGFLGAVGLDASVSIGKAQDVEGDASFYNLIECPSYFNASPTPNGVKEIFFEVSVGTGAGVGGELIAALQAGQIGSNRSAINGSYSSYENKYSSRKISSYKMSAELLTSSPFLGVTTGLPGVNDLTAAALAIHYGGIVPSEFDQAKPALSFSPEVFNLSYAEDTYQLEISNIGTGEIEWEIVPLDVEWMTVTPMSGTGRTLVDIIVDENTTGKERTAELYINSNGGNSEPIVINQGKELTSEWPRDTTTEVVDVYNPETGRTWMDRNLGASRAATSSTDEEAYGDLYQWGRAADGHQKRTSVTTSVLSNNDQPSHGEFILATVSPYDWRSPQNHNLWQDVNGINNPCPGGYRLPTEAEWEAERISWNSNSRNGAFASPLKLPVSGMRLRSDGLTYYSGSYAGYWSSTVSGTNTLRLDYDNSNASLVNTNRALGLSVRCIKD